MLEVRKLMVFCENAIEINNINEMQTGRSHRGLWCQKSRQVLSNADDFEDHFRCKEERED